VTSEYTIDRPFKKDNMKAPKLSPEHQKFIANNAENLTQRELADHIGRHQSIVAKYLINRKINSKFAHRSRKIAMPEPKPIIQRAPPIYTQSSSPFGIADKHHQIILKK
jgi:hypothetical protein